MMFRSLSHTHTHTHTHFYYRYDFQSDVSRWNTANAITMDYMFSKATSFNSNLSSWNTTNVKSMNRIFQYARLFQGRGIEGWRVNSVTDMTLAFANTENLDKDLSSWHVSQVTAPQDPNVFSNAEGLSVCSLSLLISLDIRARSASYSLSLSLSLFLSACVRFVLTYTYTCRSVTNLDSTNLGVWHKVV